MHAILQREFAHFPLSLQVALFTCLLMLTSWSNPSYALRFERIATDHRNTDIGAIKAVAQDAEGFIWMGGEYGLARYDGVRLVRYNASPGDPGGLSSNYINDLLLDQTGVLWIATDSGLNRYNASNDNFTVLLPDGGEGANNRIAALALDTEQNLVLARDTGLSLLNPERREFSHFPMPREETRRGVSLQTVFVGHDRQIWVGTRGAGVGLLNPDTGRWNFHRHIADTNSVISDNILAIAQDAQGHLWFGSNNQGVSRFDPEQQFFEHYQHQPENNNSLSSNNIWDIHADRYGYLWFATDPGGLVRYDPGSQAFTTFRHRMYDPHSLNSNQVRTIFEDRKGDLWVGAFPAGLNYLNRLLEQFQTFSHQPSNPYSISHSGILTLLKDRQGTLWVGTERGLNAFDYYQRRFHAYTRDTDNPHALQADTILSLAEDEQGALWAGTWSGGVQRFDPDRKYFTQYLPDANDPSSLNNAFVWALVHDRKGRLWLGTEGGGLNQYHPESDTFTHHTHRADDPHTINSNHIWSMLEDRQGQIWVGTSAGLNRFDPDTLRFTRFKNENQTGRFNSERVRSFMEDQEGRIWIGTQDNGFYIYHPSSQTFEHVAGNRLPAQYVTGFVEDALGWVWASTTNGLVRINPTTMEMQMFNKSHGLAGNNFNREANFRDADGLIYFGGTEGLSVFNPGQVQTLDMDFPIKLTELRILNVPVSVGPDSPLQKAIWQTSQLSLGHEHLMFTVHFAALNYRSAGQTHYAYQMEGFDRQWHQIGTDTSATFTNLRPGEYTFKVMAGTADQWAYPPATLTINILPPPWKTWWAYSLYTLFAGVFIYLLVYAKMRAVELSGERATNQELTKLNQIKDAFLANTSHELRTPLNGIIGIADALAEQHQAQDQDTAYRLQLIASSGRRLANLINDILDYSQLAHQNLVINAQPTDLVAVTETVFTLLEPLTDGKNIQLQHTLPREGMWVNADENRLQQILINLIGNGIKYSENGKVSIGARRRDGWAEVSVKDSGIGIAEEHHQHIFEAFSQVQNGDDRQYGGTGLGLAITRQLVAMHKGEIWVESRPNQGATFIFTLPLCGTGLETDEARSDCTAQLPHPGQTSKKTSSKKPDSNEPESPPRNALDQTILIVDDDSVNRLVLSGFLALHNYRILEAESGQDAINTLAENPQIDLIIMDIMMPGMTGVEACQIIRKQYALHELPILFLTAKKNVENDVAECFAAGGNDYFTKPVSKSDLLPRVANHLRVLTVVRKLQLDIHKSKG